MVIIDERLALNERTLKSMRLGLQTARQEIERLEAKSEKKHLRSIGGTGSVQSARHRLEPLAQKSGALLGVHRQRVWRRARPMGNQNSNWDSAHRTIPLTEVNTTYALTSFMKVVSSIKSAKKRHPACQVVRRKGKIYVINKVEPRYKARQG